MTPSIRRLLAALSLVLFTSTAWAEAPAKSKSKPKAAAEPSKGLIWEAKGKNGTAYLLGSIHMADKTLYPLAPAIEKAFESSSSLMVEADVSGEQTGLQTKLMAMGMYTNGDSLKKNVSKETYSAASKQCTSLGLPTNMLDMFKPWMAALTLTALAAQKSGLDPKLGLDMHFLNAAKTTGKQVVELEGIDFQLNLFNSLAAEQQEAFLFYSSKELANFNESIRKIMKAWKAGDATEIERLMNKEEMDEPKLKPAMDALITKRNIGMTDKITAALESGKTTFVVVGAAHLVGDEGVVKLLQKKGYAVERK